MSILDHLHDLTYTATGWNRVIDGDESNDTNDYYFPQAGVTFNFTEPSDDTPISVRVAIGGEAYDQRAKAAKEAAKYWLSDDGQSLTAEFTVVEGQPITEVVTVEPQPEIGDGRYLTHNVTFFDGMQARWICD